MTLMMTVRCQVSTNVKSVCCLFQKSHSFSVTWGSMSKTTRWVFLKGLQNEGSEFGGGIESTCERKIVAHFTVWKHFGILLRMCSSECLYWNYLWVPLFPIQLYSGWLFWNVFSLEGVLLSSCLYGILEALDFCLTGVSTVFGGWLEVRIICRALCVFSMGSTIELLLLLKRELNPFMLILPAMT